MRIHHVAFQVLLIALIISPSKALAAEPDASDRSARYEAALRSAKPKLAYETAKAALESLTTAAQKASSDYALWEWRTAYAADLNDKSDQAEKLYRDACPRLAQARETLLEGECLAGLGAILSNAGKDADAQRISNDLAKRTVAQRGPAANAFLMAMSDNKKEQAIKATLTYALAVISSFERRPIKSDPYFAHAAAEGVIRFASELVDTNLEPQVPSLISNGLTMFATVIGRTNPEMTDLMQLALETLPPSRTKKDTAQWAIEIATADTDSRRASMLFSTAIGNLRFGDWDDDVSVALWRWTNHVQSKHGVTSIESANALSLLAEWLANNGREAESKAVSTRSDTMAAKYSDNDLRTDIEARNTRVREFQDKTSEIRAKSQAGFDETIKKISDLAKPGPRQPGRADLSAADIKRIADEKIDGAALASTVTEHLKMLSKASYEIHYPPDVKIGNTVSDEEAHARSQQVRRISDIGIDLALSSPELNPALFEFLSTGAMEVAFNDGTGAALKYTKAVVDRLPKALNPGQRLLLLSLYPRLFVLRIKSYRLSSSGSPSPLGLLDEKFRETIALGPLIAGGEGPSPYVEALHSYARVYIENGRYSQVDEAIKAADAFGKRTGKVDRAQREELVSEQKSARERAAAALKKLNSSLQAAKQEHDATKRREMLQDAAAETLLYSDDVNVAPVALALSRLSISDEVADLNARASTLVFSPFAQLTWRRQLGIDGSVFQFLGGAVQADTSNPSERETLLEEAIKNVQLRANDSADSALLRSAARSLLQTPLQTTAKQFDDAFVIWRREVEGLIERVSAGDLVVPEASVAALDQSRNQSSALEKRLVAEAPQYQQSVGLATYSSKDIAQALQDDEALVYYVYKKQTELFAIVITKTGKSLYNLNAYAQTTNQDKLDFDEALKRYTGSFVNRKAEFDVDTSQAIYRRLIAPLEDEIGDKHHLIIIPEGPLLGIPFAALRTTSANSQGKWLIDGHSLTLALSLKSFLALRQTTPLGGGTSFRAFANPVIHDDKNRCAPYSGFLRRAATSEGICPLQETSDQASALASIFGADPQSSIISGERLSPEAVERNLGGKLAAVVFATHALQPSEAKSILGSEQPALLVGETNSLGETRSSWLTADKIELLNIDADLVILSACNSGAPEGDKATALSGLARAFFAAGARGVMATTWYIDAGATRDLVSEIASDFRAKAGTTLPDAMQAAMSKRAQQGIPPRDWAQFSYVGR